MPTACRRRTPRSSSLIGGGLRDAGWDGAQRPASRLAILPGRTRYDVAEAPELPGMVADFLA